MIFTDGQPGLSKSGHFERATSHLDYPLNKIARSGSEGSGGKLEVVSAN